MDPLFLDRYQIYREELPLIFQPGGHGMDYFPVFLDVRNRPCLVVGGGEVATRKAQLLLKSGARVTLVAPALCETAGQLVERGEVLHIPARFSPGHLRGMVLVIAATDDAAVNEEVSAAANALHLPVNVVDSPQLCSFVVPSIVDRSPVIVAIGSSGKAPVLARLLRTRLEGWIPQAYGKLAALAGAFREQAKSRFADVESRRRFWENVFEGPIAEMVFCGREAAARHALLDVLNRGEGKARGVGEVYLVGAGPGNPDLLTFRALRLMQKADVVVYDHLVGEGILDLVRRDAQRIYAGKQAGNHALPQEEINVLLERLAREGKCVVRLKGGDPFVFGRGGEELEALAQAGIPFEVVPGITAACGVSSYAGIPLTHRDHAQSVTFVTGHLKDGSVDLDWEALARPCQTVVIYMGVGALAQICEQLIAHGMAPALPAAMVERGTTDGQRVVTATVGTLAQEAARAGIEPPALAIIGEVVKLRERLNWLADGQAAGEGPNRGAAEIMA
jgi:uroporphyrin-III C-methyltransferase/precorrin-2 dehydrogenase/sirohydrochlorin ferrochelatase